MNLPAQERCAMASPPADDADAVRREVTGFLARFVDDTSILQEEHLITSGLLDSLAAVELIGYLERQFGIEVMDGDLEIANFDSIAAIVAFVVSKRPA
jgi:methoxymalonate biosynthesis acyl carrier protein